MEAKEIIAIIIPGAALLVLGHGRFTTGIKTGLCIASIAATPSNAKIRTKIVPTAHGTGTTNGLPKSSTSVLSILKNLRNRSEFTLFPHIFSDVVHLFEINIWVITFFGAFCKIIEH